MQKGLFAKSWKSVFNNLILLLPDIVYVFLSGLGAFIFGYFSGIINFAVENYQFDDFFFLLADYFRENLGKVIVSLIGFIIFAFFVGVGRDVLKFGMIKDIINNKKADIKNSWKKKHEYYMKIVNLRVLVFLIYFSVSVVFGALFGLFGINEDNVNWALLTLMLGLLMILLIVLSIILLFRYAILFEKGYSARITVKESFRLFKKDYRKFFFVVVILGATNIVFSLALTLLSEVPYFGILFNTAISLLISAWSNVYIFYSYKG